MQIDNAGLTVLRALESCALKAFWDVNGYAIGYGHHGKDITSDTTCTVEQAEAYLAIDTEQLSNSLSNLIKVQLSQGQFNALVIFSYNVGITAFKNSALLSRLNSGNFACVPYELRRWNESDGKVNQGLVNRREKEIQVWQGTETT